MLFTRSFLLVVLLSYNLSAKCSTMKKIGFSKIINQIKVCTVIPCLQLALAMGGPAHALEQPPTIPAITKSSDQNIPMYFGVGCFWHTQHEFIETERSILGRTDEQLTVSITSFLSLSVNLC